METESCALPEWNKAGVIWLLTINFNPQTQTLRLRLTVNTTPLLFQHQNRTVSCNNER